MCHQAGGIVGALVGGIAFDAFGSYQLLIALDLAMCAAAAGGYLWLQARASFATGARPVQAPGHTG
ncbi:hypothetical protein [Cohnella nanjingensis]|nr:hypothetical protein [Cohnella nanjingensis]